MFDKKSDYALNKLDSDASVYKGASGVHIRLTREDFTNEEEFLRWKDWSDGSYCEIEKADASYSKRICGLSEWSGSTQSPEAAMIEAQNQKDQEQFRRLLLKGLDTCLTLIQCRRIWLYCVESLTVRQIAQLEGVAHQNVTKSIKAAKGKIKNSVLIGCQSPVLRTLSERYIQKDLFDFIN